MRVLGSLLIGITEQRSFAHGATVELEKPRVMTRIRGVPSIGDLLWVKEPWRHLTSRRFGPQNVDLAFPGPVGLLAPPNIARFIGRVRMKLRDALTLAKDDSRITLEIMAVGEHSIRCLIHFVQVDELLQRKRGADA